jgi:DNA polymerase-3 subunit delta
VLWALSDEIRAIGRVLSAAAAGGSPPQLWHDAKVWGASHQAAMQRNLRRFTREQVEAAIAHAAKADRTIKGLIRGDAWDELLQLALRFASGAPGKPAPRRSAAPAQNKAQPAPQSGLF